MIILNKFSNQRFYSSKFFNTLVEDVTASNSIGVRLKNTATLESVGRIIQSFSR